LLFFSLTPIPAAQLELANRTLRDRLRFQEESRGGADEKLSAERAAVAAVEAQMHDLRRRLRQRKVIAQTGVAPPPAAPPPAAPQRQCIVCHKGFPAAEWRAHTMQCVEQVVRGDANSGSSNL
jgi:hypothetical protein